MDVTAAPMDKMSEINQNAFTIEIVVEMVVTGPLACTEYCNVEAIGGQ